MIEGGVAFTGAYTIIRARMLGLPECFALWIAAWAALYYISRMIWG